jgi:hypothetical protein
MTALHPSHYALAAATILIGLALDLHVEWAGQLALSAVVWAVLAYLLARVEANERTMLLACLVIATAGEIALSLGWGLYTYRLGNIPPFVPPGHVLMLMLGMRLARGMSARAAFAIVGSALLYAIAATVSGLDTFAAALALVLLGAWLFMPAHRALYASTFVLSLALELYGTWLGNWTWSAGVPAIGLTTTNPPALAGAFYAALDACVLVAMLLLVRCTRKWGRTHDFPACDVADGMQPRTDAARGS